jgi:tRNA nucleotidyltransferase/poly(A) polymerase
MPDYIYLFENRLSADQQSALRLMREAARDAGSIVFLTGDAVRDLTSGHAVRDLEVVVNGNALKLKKTIEKLGGKVWGEDEASRSLYLCFPGTVRVDVISAHGVEYPKPGKAIIHPASIQEDLRRRDFTVNAMALSLNEGSYGLLIDPLNGAADIETRTLRLTSNYKFLEDPSLLIRATRYQVRLGWELEPKTQTRYQNAKDEGVIEFLSAEARSRELEQIGHEEDGLKVLRALEADGWMNVLFPAWTSAKADEEKLKALHELAVELLMQGVHADMSAAQMQLLTAKLTSRELTALKKLMLRPGFVEEWNSLDALAAGFAKVLTAKVNSVPSTCFKLFTSYDPEAILWLGFTSRDAAVRERFDLFLKVWPEARQRIPHALMQEMRITPELASYREIVQAVFLELIDGRLTTPEEIRAFLEPHSPPAPPPQMTIKRPRAKRGAEAKVKERTFEDDEAAEDELDEDDDLGLTADDEDEIDLGLTLPKVELDSEIATDNVGVEHELELEPELEEDEPAPAPMARPFRAPVQRKGTETTQAAVPGAARREEEKPEVLVPPVTQALPPPAKAEKPASKAPPKPEKAAPVKPRPGVPVKKPVPAPVRTKAEAPPKLPAKAPAKPPIKASIRPSPKPAAKAPAGAKSKAPAAKSAPPRGQPAPAAKPKASKASHPAKPAKPAGKKSAAKAAKKR